MPIARLTEASTFRSSILPAAHVAATVNGAGVDAKGFERALGIIHVGVIDFGATPTLKLQHSDTSGSSGFVDVVGGSLTGVQIAAAAAGTGVVLADLQLSPNLRKWLRWTLGITNTGSEAVNLAAGFVLVDHRVIPFAQPHLTLVIG